ncbi:FAD-dependent monooxygenase [Gordonia sp. CPCC 205333]|uniref:FAD-dependent monooxygenase n=1 Tax=Gordonia sp. CPCC 205333 TaxID=3140790 RepID=UPI003AF3CB22
MKIGIVGGGFAGLSAAIAFRHHGHGVTVYEKTAEPPAGGGAISLAQNALTCLEMLGVRERISTTRWADTPASVRSANGKVLVHSTLPKLTGGTEYATVPRSQLLRWLTEQLPADSVQYSTSVTGVDPDGSVQISDNVRKFDLVVGADGPNGIVRSTLWPSGPAARLINTTNWAWFVDKDLREGFGTIWGRTAQFGVLPLNDGRTYVYGGASRHDIELSAFRDWPAPLPELINAARPEHIIRPRILEARPPRQLTRGHVVLIGDAAHTMQPTFGQGAALAMEDALTLACQGTQALSRRRRRMLALYAMSKAGAYFATPQNAFLEIARNTALHLTPGPVFNRMAGTASRWQPPKDLQTKIL